MAKSSLAVETLTMVPVEPAGCWLPASAADRRLLGRILRPRDGDPIRHPGRDQAGFLVALCASRGVILIFDPTRELTAVPSPASKPGQGGRPERPSRSTDFTH